MLVPASIDGVFRIASYAASRRPCSIVYKNQVKEGRVRGENCYQTTKMPGDKSVIEISDDKRVEEPPTTLVNEKAAKEDIEALAQAPDWLPDGWIMEVYCEEDGTIRRVYMSYP